VRSALPLIAALALGALGPAACRPATAPAPEARSAAPAPAPATEQPLPAPAPTTAAPPASTGPDAGWQELRTSELAIRLPAGWQAGETGDGSTAWPDFEQNNPELAGFLGGGEARIEAVFSAREGAHGAQGIRDNLNIRRAAMDGAGAETLPEIAEAVASQYRTLGFEVRETARRGEIGGLPAVHIVTAFPAAGREGETHELVALQVLAAAPDALWVLTYTTAGERFEETRAVFEQSAQSFEVWR
jgi:hypothetical protein